MYQFHYADVLADDMNEARRAEREIFDTILSRLSEARLKGPDSQDAVDALFQLDRFWKALIEDLAHPDNGLPVALKRNLIQVGVWVLGEIGALRAGRSHSFDALIDVNSAIRDGLKEAA